MRQRLKRDIIRVARPVLGAYSSVDRAARLRWDRLPTLPTFMIIGAAFSGTSWLKYNLIKHPEVAIPPYELMYFDFWLFRPLRWYGSHYRGLGDFPARGDKSPGYWMIPVDHIRLIKDLMPNVRLVLVVRDPVQRAWADYRQYRGKYGVREPPSLERFLSFHALRAKRARARGQDPEQVWLYSPIVANWLHVFPREQLLAVSFDRIVSDPDQLVQDVLVHIGVDPLRYPWEKLSRDKVAPKPALTMPEEIGTYLRRSFIGERDALATLLQCEPLWREFESDAVESMTEESGG